MASEANSATPLNSISLNVQRQTNVQDKAISHHNVANSIVKHVKITINNHDVSPGEEDDDEDEDNKDDEVATDIVKLDKNESRSISSQSTNSSGTDGTDIVKLGRSKDSPTLTSKKLVALFIGDLDEKVTEKNLRDTFNKFESFVSAKICIDSNTKKSLGYGYLNFSNEEDAERVIEEFNYIPVFGREVRLMPSLRNSFYRKNIGTNVFFSNLPLENLALTTRVFYDAFKKYGKILSCKLDRRKNIGFVYFEKDSAAKEAIAEYNGKEFFGNNILCGIHFDRNVRKSPEFEKRKARLEDMTLVKESLVMDNNQEIPSGSKMKGPHPNAVFIKNLPLNPDSDLLLDYFSQIGPVKSIFTSNVSKLNSAWAFITFKKGSDAQDAIDSLNHSQLVGRTIELSRAQKNFQTDIDAANAGSSSNAAGSAKSTDSDGSPQHNSSYKLTVYLSSLSSICSEQFLQCFCAEERIKTKRICIRFYDESTLTFSGFVQCQTRNDANRLFELLNKKLLGDSTVKASWKPCKEAKPINTAVAAAPAASQLKPPNSHKKPAAPVNIRREPYIYRAPAPEYRGYNPLKNKMLQQQVLMAPSNAKPVVKDPNSKETFVALKKEVRRYIDFLKFPLATREQNLNIISKYILEVFYQNRIEAITRVLLMKQNHNYFERQFQEQVEESIAQLGLEGR
ncbi:HGL195Cp [Eremothecium sinecaudum]|uniref:HGL195Cp n=1 Tax=Eremothecium sinecaudum TaxID=45286 RepID=A0A0X8HVH3_9SACH|nr:HGL195Cp [Eremothecium sinecaudum]AMD22145.1 HGL195Cp [Eremothecium sinecaudum]